MTEEIWKDIPGYEGRYQASTLGRIRSVDRWVEMKNKYGSTYKSFKKGTVLRPGQYCKSGHVSVVLGNGKPGSPVHQLVALTFIGERPKGADVCHNNGDPKDNRPENLRYDTRSENNLDVFRIGKAWRKLTLEDYASIQAEPAEKTSTQIARERGLSIAHVCKIRKGDLKACQL